MDRNRQLNLLYFAIAMMAVVFIQSLWAETRMVQVIPYSTFEELLDEGAMDSVTVGTNAISGYYTDVDVDAIAGMTTGFSGADLANLVNEAALLATRRKAEAVGMEDFTAAVERIVAGLEKKNRVLTPRERRVVAHHEILMSQGELEDKIAVLLGGRAAERLVFEELSTGAADDLAKATDIARGMVMRYGMDEGLGSVSYEDERPTFLNPAEPQTAGRRVSEATARRIDAAVQAIIARAFDRATDVLTENRGVLETAAARLLEKETLDQDELRVITEPLRRRPAHGGSIEFPVGLTIRNPASSRSWRGFFRGPRRMCGAPCRWRRGAIHKTRVIGSGRSHSVPLSGEGYHEPDGP